ncbi:MAG TPA: PepSY-associated TM helix domain-containing protein [Blastocatellia bacterium]|nr:PepSY-associated TM helix domain-containing protein [Blastocatellia bacterium]
MKIRKALLTAHLIAGLVSAVFLIISGVTGSVMVFEEPLDRALNAKLSYVNPENHRLSLNELKTRLETAHPGYRLALITMQDVNNLSWPASLVNTEQKQQMDIAVNPYNGQIIGSLDQSNSLIGEVHQFHIRLLAGKAGQTVMFIAAILLLLLAISGLILWWPRKIFKINLRSSGKRFTFDLHNAVGIYSSLFLLVFSITAIVIHFDNELADWIDHISGTTAKTPERPEPPKPDALQMSPDQLVAIAEQAVPGAHVRTIQLPGDPKRSAVFAMRFPEDLTPGGRTRVMLDSYTGKVLFVQDSRMGPLGFRMIKVWNRAIHTGDVLGWPSKLLVSFFSLMLPVMAITGPLIWWGRRKKESQPKTVGQMA